LLDLVDVARVDHFRGFAACWEIPSDAPTAQAGRWVEAPGRVLFRAIEAEHGRPLPLVAEDLGVITDDVHALRDEFGLPGLRVLQFAFGDDPDESIFLPHRYIPNCVAYTGTHDNDTLAGWLDSHVGADSTRSQEAIAREHRRILAYVGGATDDLAWALMERLFHSVAGATIVPLQDVLALGSEARMNVPGRAAGNWGWRLSSFSQLEGPWQRLAELTRAAGRGAFQGRE
jgi:4-alpha-glucanotransferase